MTILHLDPNHPLLIDHLNELGFRNIEEYSASKAQVESCLDGVDGIIIRSRFKIDKQFLQSAKDLKFIGRVGSGLENIDLDAAEKLGITVFGAPEGNCNAVGEHALGMLLSLFNNLNRADREVRQGIWKREENRGIELEGKTVGLIGYGNTGKAFAKKLRGFDVNVLCHDIKPDVGDENARQVSLDHIKEEADILSLHIPLTPLTDKLIDSKFLQDFKKNIWLINTSRGQNVVAADLVKCLKSGKVSGACLDVLEYEKLSFENLDEASHLPEAFQYLIQADNVMLTPHIAGWTHESKIKLALVIVDKIKTLFKLG